MRAPGYHSLMADHNSHPYPSQITHWCLNPGATASWPSKTLTLPTLHPSHTSPYRGVTPVPPATTP